MSMINVAELNRLAERYPHVLERSFWQRYRAPISIGVLAIYFLFCWWFFAIGKTLTQANWGIAGNYLADWVSTRSARVRHRCRRRDDDQLSALRSDRPEPEPGLDRDDPRDHDSAGRNSDRELGSGSSTGCTSGRIHLQLHGGTGT